MTARTEAQKAFWTGVGAAVATPFLIAFGAFWGSFPIMIALGIWHHDVDPRVPALGFLQILGISWGLATLISKFRTKYDFGQKKAG